MNRGIVACMVLGASMYALPGVASAQSDGNASQICAMYQSIGLKVMRNDQSDYSAGRAWGATNAQLIASIQTAIANGTAPAGRSRALSITNEVNGFADQNASGWIPALGHTARMAQAHEFAHDAYEACMGPG